MATALEIIVPLAIAAYSGWTDWNKCTGPTDPNPYVETFCGRLRDSMNDACTSALSLPIPSTSIQLTAHRKITPVAFGEHTKSAIKATYGACTDFWTKKISYSEYRARLETNAAELDVLFAAVAPGSKGPSPFRDALAAATVSDERVEPAASRLKEQLDRCASDAIPCSPSAPPDAVTKKDLEDLETRILSQISQSRSGTNTVTLKDPPPNDAPTSPTVSREQNSTVVGEWKLITDVAFRYASAVIGSPESCARIVGRVLKHTRVETKHPLRIRAVGYADTSGSAVANQKLSERRSESVLACFAAHPKTEFVVNGPEGEGVLEVPATFSRAARRVSVYVRVSP